MKNYYKIILSLTILLILSIGWGQTAHLEIQNVNLTEGTLDIYMTNDVPVTGFQFQLSGLTVVSATGGEIVPDDWLTNGSGDWNNIMGYSIDPNLMIPAVEGVLVTVSFTDYSEEEICIPVVNNSYGGFPLITGEIPEGELLPIIIPSTVGDCITCDVVDDCGVCDGDGSACSGSAHLEIQNVNLSAGTLDIYMINDVPVAGFEFYLSGMTITNLTGGTADEYLEIVVFNSPIGKILGASISGATIPPGDGVLTTVYFTVFEGDTICFVNDDSCANSTEVCEDCTADCNTPVVHIIADYNANEIPSTWGNCFGNNDNWVYGCTYDTATNYNPDATFDDGSCDFMWGDVNHDGQLTIQDLILIVNEILSF